MVCELTTTKYLPLANKVCEDYVFTGVCLSLGGVSVSVQGDRDPSGQRPPDRDPGQRSAGQRPPRQRTPGQRTPWTKTPLTETPWTETPRQRTPRTVMDGWYAFYWNAFLFFMC